MQKTLIFTCTIIGLCTLFSFNARADEAYLKNADRITGETQQTKIRSSNKGGSLHGNTPDTI
jgi:hypothetical protein